MMIIMVMIMIMIMMIIIIMMIMMIMMIPTRLLLQATPFFTVESNLMMAMMMVMMVMMKMIMLTMTMETLEDGAGVGRGGEVVGNSAREPFTSYLLKYLHYLVLHLNLEHEMILMRIWVRV